MTYLTAFFFLPALVSQQEMEQNTDKQEYIYSFYDYIRFYMKAICLHDLHSEMNGDVYEYGTRRLWLHEELLLKRFFPYILSYYSIVGKMHACMKLSLVYIFCSWTLLVLRNLFAPLLLPRTTFGIFIYLTTYLFTQVVFY